MKFVLKFWKSLPFIKDFFLSKEVESYKKLLSSLLILTYTFFPFDLIPDFLFLWGYVDDVVIIGLIIERMVKWAPETLKSKYHLHDKK
ncbi:YkvA family protein [Bacillus sp. B15-48]|uniref:YkvA family protein n=1 Tax=Bacillus sp. B15-48 TaxID=1548601 RepID=UPI0031B876E2